MIRTIVTALVLLLPATAPGVSLPLSPGEHTIRLQYEGRERSYVVHVPPAARDRAALPVVLSFHGGGGSAAHQQRATRMHELGAKEGFIVVYPNGGGRLESKLLTWNAGSCCGYSAAELVDDVGFVAALLDDLGSRTRVDRSRVYATGFSNGAMMAHRLAAERPDLVAAIAPVGGAMVLERREPRKPVPLMHVHSVDDPRALYAGGLGPPFPGTNNRVEHPPVEASLARWTKANGCVPTGHTVETRSWEEHTAEKISFNPCASGAELVHWRLHGPGHVWPGGEPTRRERLTGPSTRVIDANREIWEFFRTKRN
ncbi:MAG: polyhydroxybutyrate depolymerase [Acidobacteria bacterium]|nr:polyhydroxybutyrate depolymerase [Acidobacteriota bacterium]